MTVDKPAESQNTDLSQYIRTYKSRSQRPCDFCRRRKSCCIIEKTLPCKLCLTFKRECTFVEGPITRPKPKLDENGQRIVIRKRSASNAKTESQQVPKKKRGRKPKPVKQQESVIANANATDIDTISPIIIDIDLKNQSERKNDDNLEMLKLESTRRFSVPELKDSSRRFHDLEIFNEPQDMIVADNDTLLEDLHYSLEDHDNSALLGSTNGASWKKVYGYIVDSPLLQPTKFDELSKLPLTSTASINGGAINVDAKETIDNALEQDVVVYNTQIFSNGTSSSASLISSLIPTASVASLDSPTSSISGAVHPFDLGRKTLSGFQFSHQQSSHAGQFISSLLQSRNDSASSNSSETNGSRSTSYNNNSKDGQLLNLTTGGLNKMTPFNHMEYQREILSILDEYGDKLMRLYLIYVNPFMPILSKSQINTILNNGQCTKDSVVANLKKLNLGLVASIIASALEYWDLDLDLILDESPSPLYISEVAFDLIFAEFELRNYSDPQTALDLLQASLIIGIKYSFDITKLDELYKVGRLKKLMAISHSITIELGLNSNFARRQSVTGFSDELDQRIFKSNLWWCFYIQEKWLSFLIGQQSLIEEQDPGLDFKIGTATNVLPNFSFQQMDMGIAFNDYDQLLSSCSCYFENMIKLTLIVSGVLLDFYKLDDDDSHSMNNEQHFLKLFQSCAVAKAYEEKLRRWKDRVTMDNFKDGFYTKQNGVIGGYMNANATLKVSHFVVSLAIQKALLRKFSNKYMNITSGIDMKTNLLFSNLKEFELKFNDIKLNAIKVSIDCFKTIKSLKVSDLNGFWYLFINMKFTFIANFFILLHMVTDKTVEELTPSIPISAADLSQSSYYNNNLQFKSTLQKVITDFQSCVKNRSSKWKYTRLANDYFKNFKGFDSLDILENYSETVDWKSISAMSKNSSASELAYKPEHFDPHTVVYFNNYEPEPLSLDEEVPKYELLSYEDKFLKV